MTGRPQAAKSLQKDAMFGMSPVIHLYAISHPIRESGMPLMERY